MMLPTWLPDAIGAISSLLLTVPAWRAMNMLRTISSLEDDATKPRQPPDEGGQRSDSRFISHDDATARIVQAMRDATQKWNGLDDFMLKSGLLLLVLSFLVRLIPSTSV